MCERVSFASIGTLRLDRQHARIQREFILDGGLAELFDMNHEAVSLLPTLAVITWHGHHRGVNVDLDTMCALSGVSRRRLVNGLGVLQYLGFLVVRDVRSTVAHIEWGSFREPQLIDWVYFPGRIIGSGVWSELTPVEHSVLLALAGVLRWHRIDPSEDGGATDWNVLDWLYDHQIDTGGIRWDIDHAELVPRAAQVPMTRIAELAGVGLSSASRAIRTLGEAADGGLLSVQAAAIGGNWYHLPSLIWDR